MRPDKSALKKTATKATEPIRKPAASAAAEPKSAPKAAAAKSTAPVSATPAPAAKAGPAIKTSVSAKAKIAATKTPAPAVTPAKSKAKTPARKAELKVPAILLEGDQPSAPSVSGPGQRYALGPVPPPAHVAGSTAGTELPEAYGTRELLLTARDPHWLYAHWDLTRQQQKDYNSQAADGHLVLRVFAGSTAEAPISDVHVHPESRHWFIHVGRAATKFVAQLGYRQRGGAWVAISTSSPTLTPPDTMSDDTSAQFATIPMEIPFAKLLALAQEVVRESVPLVEVLQQLRAHGFSQFALDAAPATVADKAATPQTVGQAAAQWTPEKEKALASIITMDNVRRVWMGSLEITELIRRQLQHDISSMAAARMSLPSAPTSPGAMGAAVNSSLSSPFGGMASQKGFWFNVNAELILYGATESDAKVTIGGKTIKLRSDGTFSYRFALPDGQYDLPAIAVSADGTDGRAAELKFTRSTIYHGDVGAHPQDPQLKAPLVANVG